MRMYLCFCCFFLFCCVFVFMLFCFVLFFQVSNDTPEEHFRSSQADPSCCAIVENTRETTNTDLSCVVLLLQYNDSCGFTLIFSRIFIIKATLTNMQIGSGNGLLSEGAKPLPEPMLIFVRTLRQSYGCLVTQSCVREVKLTVVCNAFAMWQTDTRGTRDK